MSTARQPNLGLRRHRSQGLLIGGLITLCGAAGISTFMLIMRPEPDKPMWAIGLIPGFIGVGLLLSGWLTRPRDGKLGSPTGG
ncbi:MAG TPA: hypothetical protein VEY91_00425 [Candidatus Limnocylindria bacterium]|nr:hypothetical protein [Candidatus Limnocylindria bacterium]